MPHIRYIWKYQELDMYQKIFDKLPKEIQKRIHFKYLKCMKRSDRDNIKDRRVI